jgi:hypothetical protein
MAMHAAISELDGQIGAVLVVLTGASATWRLGMERSDPAQQKCKDADACVQLLLALVRWKLQSREV